MKYFSIRSWSGWPRQWSSDTYTIPASSEEETQEKVHWSCQPGDGCKFLSHYNNVPSSNIFYFQDPSLDESGDEQVSFYFYFVCVWNNSDDDDGEGRRIFVCKSWHRVPLFDLLLSCHSFFHISQHWNWNLLITLLPSLDYTLDKCIPEDWNLHWKIPVSLTMTQWHVQ